MIKFAKSAAFCFCIIASVTATGISTCRDVPVRLLRYHPDGTDIVIKNGKNRFNRPLYGSTTAFFVYASDLPKRLCFCLAKVNTLVGYCQRRRLEMVHQAS